MLAKNILSQYKDTDKLMLVSFFATNPPAVARLEYQWSFRNKEHTKHLGRGIKETQMITSKDFGGAVSLIDPNNMTAGILAEIKVPVATGMFYSDLTKILYVGSNKWVRLVKNGKVIGDLGNTLFNDLHTLTSTPTGNLLVASTGVDGILEISLSNPKKLVWSWLATEQGYSTLATGKTRVIDRNMNYQEIGTSTPMHTTHLSSAIEYKSDKVLTTLFHQGTVIEIDKNTGKTVIMLDGLKSPHHIRETKDGFVVSDTRNNRVLILDNNFNTVAELDAGFNWVQDCIYLEDGNYLVADSNNSRLVKMSKGNIVLTVFDYPPRTRKIASTLYISVRDLKEIF